MTHDEMFGLYNHFSAADKFLTGFRFHHEVYYTMTDSLQKEMTRLDHTSANRGGYATMRVRITAALKRELVESGRAVHLGHESILDADDKYNKGERFERIITETLTPNKWVKDTVKFNVAGDITLNGKEVQIKWENATYTTEVTLRNLLAAA